VRVIKKISLKQVVIGVMGSLAALALGYQSRELMAWRVIRSMLNRKDRD